jgi:microcompartment protein CcmL/EutN
MTIATNPTVLGALEFDGVAAGLFALDKALKAAPIDIVAVRTICPGKYVILLSGSEASVEASLANGRDAQPEALLDMLYLPNVHPGVIPALATVEPPTGLDAVGVLEALTAIGAIEAADRAAKRADVKLLHIRIGDEMGGRSSVKLMGSIGEVETAIHAGGELLDYKQILYRKVVIPRPDEQVAAYILQG